MKKLLLSVAFALIFTNCNGKKAEEHGHDHDDGTHQHGESETPSVEVQQEEFTVTSDSLIVPEHDEQHEKGEPHQH